MSIGRRSSTDARRRRVLAYQSSREGDDGTSLDRRTVEKLRQARRPAAIYGASVRRRLRGRWFSLVPVRRRAIAGAALAVLGTAALLCMAHWLAITWQPLAYREPLARPLRLDRPDSFGTWARATYLAVAAGASLLIYQLRRYRNDDYRGSYRIWPPVIILITIASVDCICGLVPWCGELVDLMLGKRIAMSGSDWIRIVLTVGGAALALRLIAEVRHSKLSLAMMLLSIACFAIPLAARWGVLLTDTPLKWWLITSAPLMAAATLCVSCGAYLRKLFREVRRLDQDDQSSIWLRQWKSRLFSARATTTDDAAPPRTRKRAAEKTKPSKPAVASAAAVISSSATPGAHPDQASGEDAAAGSKRFAWLWRRRRKTLATASAAAQSPKPTPEPAAQPAAAQMPTVPKPAAGQVTQTADAAKDSASAAPANPRRGLSSIVGGWLRRSKPGADTKAANAATPAARPASTVKKNSDDEDDDADGDASIDWASMGKAERRRLRRELKRGGDAA